MKIDRMLGILTFLLQRERTTATELAKTFEVSTRTILRDLESINQAGIPLVTFQGSGGGVSIAEGYRLDRQLLTTGEVENLLMGLEGIQSLMGTGEASLLMEKLKSTGKFQGDSGNKGLRIDLISHYRDSLPNKISLIKNAIKNHRVISFDYYSEQGKQARQIEPYRVSYQWGDWYVYGFCLKREDFRLFKLNRLWKLEKTEDCFVPKIGASEHPASTFQDEKKVTLRMDAKVEYLLVESYGPDCYEKEEDGSLTVSLGYSSEGFILSWIFQFGEHAEILEPESLRQKMKKRVEKLSTRYDS